VVLGAVGTGVDVMMGVLPRDQSFGVQ